MSNRLPPPPTDDYFRQVETLDLDGLISYLSDVRAALGNLPVTIATQYSDDDMVARIEADSVCVRIIPTNFSE